MRIFWLGMHKILVKTELVRLRQLGFEVFNPPFLGSGTEHQSASRDWDTEQPTTLPPDVFERLSKYSFFFNLIEPEIADLLNTYFDVMIVTIDPHWLAEVVKVFKKKIIYRNYGHVSIMSDFLWNLGAFRQIVERDDFWYVPHAAEAARHEHQWLRDREIVVPYTPTDDVFKIRDRWDPKTKKTPEIMVSCPNLTNPFYMDHFRYLKKNFNEPHYRFYGVQMGETPDSQLVGTLPFDEVLERYTQVAGFIYTYRNPAVCFLPPIEMMIAGGPVIFLEGSLLDQYFHGEAPGRAKDETEAKQKCERLLRGDSELISAILRSQEAVRRIYLPEDVWPVFDRVFLELLSPSVRNRGKKLLFDPCEGVNSPVRQGPRRIYCVTHPFANAIVFSVGAYSNSDPELDALKERLELLAQKAQAVDQVVLTCQRNQLVGLYGFLRHCFQDARFRFWVIEEDASVVALTPAHDRLEVLPTFIRKGIRKMLWYGACVQAKVLHYSERAVRRYPVLSGVFNFLRRRLEPFYCRAMLSDSGSRGVVLGNRLRIPEYCFLKKAEFKDVSI